MAERPDGTSRSPRHFACRSKGLPPRRQYDLWAELGSACTALPDPASSHGGFDFEVNAWHLGRGLLAHWRQSPQRLLRNRSHIRADGRDQYVLVLGEDAPRAGNVEGHPVEVARGQLCLLDLSRPFDLVRNGASSISYVMPRSLLDEAVPPADRHGLLLDGGMAKVLTEHLSSLARHAADLNEKQLSTVNRATRNLLAAVLDQGEERTAEARPLANAALLTRAKCLIERRLDLGRLSIEGLYKALGISRSQLYRLFAECGGVAAYAKSRRLAKAKETIEAGERGTIGDIAARHGFSDEAYFSRAFRRAYGVSPRDCRRAGENALDVPPVATRRGRHPWVSWVESLD